MAMQSQYFLPVMTPDNVVVGTFPIPTTTFTGNETSITLSGTPFPARKITQPAPLVGDHVAEYMAVVITYTEFRQTYKDLPSLLPGLLYRVTYPTWHAGVMFTHDGDLDLLMRGFGKSTATPAVVPPPLAPDTVTVTRYVNNPFGNASDCAFFDIQWTVLTGLTAEQLTRVASVSIGTPTSDPGLGASLRAYVVQNTASPRAFEGSGSVRIVKVNKAGVTAGTYTWPITLVDTSKQSVTFNLTLTAA